MSAVCTNCDQDSCASSPSPRDYPSVLSIYLLITRVPQTAQLQAMDESDSSGLQGLGEPRWPETPRRPPMTKPSRPSSASTVNVRTQEAIELLNRGPLISLPSRAPVPLPAARHASAKDRHLIFPRVERCSRTCVLGQGTPSSRRASTLTPPRAAISGRYEADFRQTRNRPSRPCRRIGSPIRS